MEPTDHNRRAWDEIHRRRTEALAGQLGLPEVVRRSLADLHGKRVLHLQCATGEETSELVELGALVTGVDISEVALEVGRERSSSILWVQADVHRLPAELRRGRFDLAYTGGGAVHWLHDLDAWASGIAQALRAGGDLLLYDEHPVGTAVDSFLRWQGDYFDEGVRISSGSRQLRGSELPGPRPQEEKHQRFWRLGQIVTAIARAQLVVRALEEYPGTASWRRLDARVPGTFLLHARKP